VSLLVQAALGLLFGLSFVRLRRLQQEQQSARRLAPASGNRKHTIRA
jgi:glucose-6-phosphate-specific signal transduction histidine kinase